MGEQDLSLQDRESFRRGRLGISISGERNNASHGEEVEKGLVYLGNNFIVAGAEDLCKQ